MDAYKVWWWTAMGCPETKDELCHKHWNQIHIWAIPQSYVSLAASIYIIIMTMMYIKQFRKITFGATLPMYIAICDALFHIGHGTDHLHNYITGYVTPGGWCLLFGAMKTFSINGQTCWCIATAFFLNFCIRNGSAPQTIYGPKFNYILHGICWGLPCLCLIIGFSADLFGIEGPWCGTKNPTNDFWMVDLWILATDIILIILYSWTFYIIYNETKDNPYYKKKTKKEELNDSANEAVMQRVKSVKKIIRTLPWFPVVYVTQWTWFLLWKLAVLERTWGETMGVIIITNFGGIFNFIVFYRLLMSPLKAKQKRLETSSRKSQELGSTTSRTGSSKDVTKDTNVSSNDVEMEEIPNKTGKLQQVQSISNLDFESEHEPHQPEEEEEEEELQPDMP